MIEYIADKEHYTKVLTLCKNVKHVLWICTADSKRLCHKTAHLCRIIVPKTNQYYSSCTKQDRNNYGII